MAFVSGLMGRFHPHGDQSAYDALVRMAQDFSQRYPLVDGQGNFGSRDGDGAAAMRYTEARLAKITTLLLEEIDQGTVDFQPNYDGSTEEPSQLPARLPCQRIDGNRPQAQVSRSAHRAQRQQDPGPHAPAGSGCRPGQAGANREAERHQQVRASDGGDALQRGPDAVARAKQAGAERQRHRQRNPQRRQEDPAHAAAPRPR
eukprot:gene29784-biopygen24470